MMGSLDCMSGNDRSRLIGEQVHRVRGMMPQQMVGPGSRLPLGVDVLASEEIRLDVHLLDVELASADLAMEILVRRVETPGVPAHRHQPGLALPSHHGFRVRNALGKQDFELDMPSHLPDLDPLCTMEALSRRQDATL